MLDFTVEEIPGSSLKNSRPSLLEKSVSIGYSSFLLSEIFSKEALAIMAAHKGGFQWVLAFTVNG